MPTFTLDGKPFAVPCFETYVPARRYFKQFADAGVRVYMFNTNVAACDYGHSKPTCPDPDTWDYSGFEERMDMVLQADPDALVIPRVNMGTPRWWLDANPDEMEALDNGLTRYAEPNRNPTLPKDRAFPSLVSMKWRDYMGDALRRFIRHVQESDYAEHMFGYFLSGLDTEEWYHWSSGSDQLAGYSRHTRNAFQGWLREKYRDIESLRKAWNRPDVTFDNASVPSAEERKNHGPGTLRNPERFMHVIDFYLFYNEIVPETIDYFARIAKEETGGSKIIGAFYGYMYEFRGDPEFGHNALQRFNESGNLDVIFVTASYENRAFGKGADYSRSPAFSVRLHNKLWYHDNDVVSFLASEVMKRAGLGEGGDWSTNAAHYMKALGATDTSQKTIWMYRRSLAFAMCNGAYESYFDLHGGYYDHPELMAEVGRLNRVAGDSVNRDRRSCSEILVVADEASCAYAGFRSPVLGESLLNTQWDLTKIGAPADHVLLNDLGRLDMSRYKLVVVLNAYNLTDAQRALLDRSVKSGGRYIVWCYAPGYFNAHKRSAKLMREATNMEIVPPADADAVEPKMSLLPTRHAIGQALAERGVTELGSGNRCWDLFHVEDTESVSLGAHRETGKVVFSLKEMSAWTSIYLLNPIIQARAYREIARAAGVHVYNEHDDTFYANRTYIALHANGAGARTIALPELSDLYDAFSDERVASNAKSFSYDFANGETIMLRRQSPQEQR
ncbi:MAG TPA: beta-galactosidase [Candidatus Brocadiia bacterium]|nr:beta-galactosidase [Candidatus Brocadiia bacterium]